MDGSHEPKEPWQRPIAEQVAALRHDMDGIKLVYAALDDLIKRLSGRVDNVEARQTVTEAQVAQSNLTPEYITALMSELFDARAAQARKERIEDMRHIFGRAKIFVLYIVPFLTALNFIASWLGWF